MTKYTDMLMLSPAELVLMEQAEEWRLRRKRYDILSEEREACRCTMKFFVCAAAELYGKLCALDFNREA